MTSMLIDSHCHLPFNIELAEQILKNASADGVKYVVNIGTGLEENPKILNVADHFLNVYAAIGIYPQSNRDQNIETLIQSLKQQIKTSKKIVAIGECGIDITNWEKQRPVNEQMELFDKQLQLAVEQKLPIIIHNRNGDKEILEILSLYKDKVTGVAHCFDSSWELAQKFLDLNFFISFSGFITYTSKRYLLETVEKVPADRFLVETDSPYIVPKGIKEKQNEPKNVKMIAQKVAEVRKTSFDEVSNNAFKNTCALFKIR